MLHRTYSAADIAAARQELELMQNQERTGVLPTAHLNEVDVAELGDDDITLWLHVKSYAQESDDLKAILDRYRESALSDANKARYAAFLANKVMVALGHDGAWLNS